MKLHEHAADLLSAFRNEVDCWTQYPPVDKAVTLVRTEPFSAEAVVEDTPFLREKVHEDDVSTFLALHGMTAAIKKLEQLTAVA